MDGTINTSGRPIKRKQGGDLKTWKKVENTKERKEKTSYQN